MSSTTSTNTQPGTDGRAATGSDPNTLDTKQGVEP